MDIPMVSLSDIEAVAAKLDRHAEVVVSQARRARAGTSETWRGEAADRHRERVAGHVDDLGALAEELSAAARAIRRLGGVAQERVHELTAIAARAAEAAEGVDVGTGKLSELLS